MVLLIAVPAAAALMLLAEPILATLFLYGDVMTARDMSMATLSLRAYSLGLIAFMLIKVLAPGFFARQDMRTPVRIGVIAHGLEYVLNLLFVVPLHFYWQVGHVGLALATSVSAFYNAVMLFFALRRKAIYAPSSLWLRFCVNLVVGGDLMLAVLCLAREYLMPWMQVSGSSWAGGSAAWRLAICLPAGLAVYAVSCGLR